MGAGPDPVVDAWEKIPWIQTRGGAGELLIFRTSSSVDDVGRKDLMTNKEIIAPMLKHKGSSAYMLPLLLCC